jgi:hypothetical protein
MAKDWDLVKEEIKRLYFVKNKPLREVMRLIEGKFQFKAS